MRNVAVQARGTALRGGGPVSDISISGELMFKPHAHIIFYTSTYTGTQASTQASNSMNETRDSDNLNRLVHRVLDKRLSHRLLSLI